MNETVSTRMEKALDRARATDPLELRATEPECFQAWVSGALRPYRVSEERVRAGFTREGLAGAVDTAVEAIEAVEAGKVYPSWLRVCRLASALDIPLERLLAGGENPESSGTDHAELAEAVDAVMKARFHPAVVAPIVSSPFGLTGEGITQDVKDAAWAGMDQALRDAAAEVAERLGLGDMAQSLRTDTDPLLALIRTGYQGRLGRFRQELFAAPDIDSTAAAGVEHVVLPPSPVSIAEARKIAEGRPPLASMGPVPAMTEDSVRLQFVGGFTAQAEMFSDDTREGTVLTLSVSATDVQTNDRVPVPAEAARPWLHAILGDAWIDHLSARGPRSGISSTMTTEYYDIFIGPDGKAQQPPADFLSGT